MLQEFNKSRIASYVCMALSASVASNAFAFAEKAEKKNQLKEVEVIEVTGVRSSLNSALNAKKNSETISDSIIAEEIGKSSDENIAQALSRISGVSLDRNGGDAQTVTVRGVQAALNDVKLNGVSMTSNTDDQAVDLSLFSADILSRIDVVKSPAANQEEGSLGASINLYTRAPLSVKKDQTIFTLEGRYNDLNEEATPRFSYTGIYKLTDNFGIAASLFHDQNNIRKDEYTTDGFFLKSYTDATNSATGEVMPGETAAVLPQYANAKVNFDDKTKTGGTLTLQYQPSEDTDIRFDGSYSQQVIDHTHSTTRLGLFDRASGPVAADISIDLGNSEMANSVDSAFTKKPATLSQVGAWKNTVDTLVLGGEVVQAIGENWLVTARVGHSDTSQDYSDSFRVNWWSKNPNQPSSDPSTWCGINYENGPQGDSLPEFNYCSNWNNDDPSLWQMGQARSEIRDVKDTKNSVYFDASRSFDSDLITSIEFGVKYTSRNKAVTHDEAVKKWKQFEDGTTKLFANAIEGVEDSSITEGHFLEGIAPAGFPQTWLAPDLDASMALAYPSGTDGLFEANPLKAWEVDEKTYGAYIQANFELLGGDITGNFGVRYANTEVEGISHSGFEYPSNTFFDEEGNEITRITTPVEDEHDYAEFLPSFTINYLATEDVVLRASAARVLARPNLDSLNPSFTVKSQNENAVPTAKGGNTQLDPFLADQFDVSAEWYFEEGALLSAALFYKDFKSFSYANSVPQQITNPIDGNCIVDRSGLPEEEQPTATSPCADVIYSTVVNGATADIHGLELAYQQNYTFLPSILSNLGSSINYTYADSSAIVDPESEDSQFNGLPFENTSKHSANATVFWEDENMTFRFAYSYRTKALVNVRNRQNSAIRDDRGTLDFSANFSITDSLKLSFSAINLTDSYDKIISVVTDPANTGLTDEFNGDLNSVYDGRVDSIYSYGRSYRLSMRYNF